MEASYTMYHAKIYQRVISQLENTPNKRQIKKTRTQQTNLFIMIPSTSSIVYSLLAQIPNQMAKQRRAPNPSVLIIGTNVWRGPNLKKPSFNSTIWSQSFSKFFGQPHIFTCFPSSPSFWYCGRASSGASLNSQHSIWVTKVQIKWDCERRPSGTYFFPFFQIFFLSVVPWPRPDHVPKNYLFPPDMPQTLPYLFMLLRLVVLA